MAGRCLRATALFSLVLVDVFSMLYARCALKWGLQLLIDCAWINGLCWVGGDIWSACVRVLMCVMWAMELIYSNLFEWGALSYSKVIKLGKSRFFNNLVPT